MKSIIFIIMLLISSMLVINASNCREGLNYCGSTLMAIGAYDPQIQAAAKDPSTTDHSSKLFKCIGGNDGDIELIESCTNECVDKGAGTSDSCNA
jgi:hypothetical protein